MVSDNIVNVKKKIENLINNNYCNEAIKVLKELIISLPEDTDIYSMYTVALSMVGRFEDAIDICKKGLEIEFNNFDLNYNLAYIYESMGEYSKALSLYNTSITYCNDEKLIESIKEITKNIHDTRKVDECNKIIFFVRNDMDSFLEDIIKRLDEEFIVKKIIVNNYNQIDIGIEWADICWFESYDEFSQYGSNHALASDKKIICKIGMYETFNNKLDKIKWTNINELIVDTEYLFNRVKGNIGIDNIYILEHKYKEYMKNIDDTDKGIEVVTSIIKSDKIKFQDLLDSLSYMDNETLNLIDNKNGSRINIYELENFCRTKLFDVNNKMKLDSDKYKIKDKLCNLDMKVIHGTIEIANQMNTIVTELKNRNINAKSLNYSPNWLEYNSDYVIDFNQFTSSDVADKELKKVASKLIAQNDVFHFHFGTSLTLDYSDLKLLKELGKKVIMQYWGSDVRLYSKAKEINPYAKVKNMNEDIIKRKLEFISKYISDCIVDYELAEYVKDYHSNVHYSRVAIDLNKYKYIDKTHNERLLIVHAPTSPEIKGTEYVLKAIDELKEKYDFDFKLIHGMPHNEAKKWYEKADLVIDQILLGGHGVFAVEAMAMGKPVICWISDFMKEKYPKELPIISANPDNIKEKIEYILNNRDMLSGIGKKGRSYAEKHHDSSKVCDDLIKTYNNI